MLKDKNGKDVSLKDVLGYLVGTDDMDMAKSVIDFSVYTINEDKTVGATQYYLVATEAIVTNVSFMGPFVMLELDFRNIGTAILKQVIEEINKFHTNLNYDNLILISTITSLDRNATHTMSLVNPIVCIRGYSEKGEGTTILQLIYSADNVGFSTYEIDYGKIDADIDRENQELESINMPSEELEAAPVELDENDEEMSEMFSPEFGFRTPESKLKDVKNSIRVSGSSTAKIQGKEANRIGDAGYDDNKIKNINDK